jgi:dipeptide transport system permease protein
MSAESLQVSAGVAPAGTLPGRLREFWSGFGANRGAVAGSAVIATLLLLAVFADLIAPHPP